MSNYESLSLSLRAPGVMQITMSRPDIFNAFDEAMIAELGVAFAECVADEAVRVIVLAGDGKHFSAGADLKWMQRASEASVEWNLGDARKFAGMLGRIDACPKPVVARVQGAALGGGTGLVNFGLLVGNVGGDFSLGLLTGNFGGVFFFSILAGSGNG